VLQCVAVCCRVLQCAVCCSLQCVAVCSVLQSVAFSSVRLCCCGRPQYLVVLVCCIHARASLCTCLCVCERARAWLCLCVFVYVLSVCVCVSAWVSVLRFMRVSVHVCARMSPERATTSNHKLYVATSHCFRPFRCQCYTHAAHKTPPPSLPPRNAHTHTQIYIYILVSLVHGARVCHEPLARELCRANRFDRQTMYMSHVHSIPP